VVFEAIIKCLKSDREVVICSV